MRVAAPQPSMYCLLRMQLAGQTVMSVSDTVTPISLYCCGVRRCSVIGSANGYKGLQLRMKPRELLQRATEGQGPLAILFEKEIFIHKCTDVKG